MAEDEEYTSIITCDMEGRIETFNEGAEKIFGYTKDEAIDNMRVSAFSPGRVVLGHVANWLSTASNEGKYEGDTTFVHKDGTLIPAYIEITPTYRTIDDIKVQIGYCGKTRVVDKDPMETMPDEPWWVTPVTWLAITRLPFLSACWMPVIFAAVWAFNGGIQNDWSQSSWPLFGLVFLGASFLHLAANTFNDYWDWQSGADQANNDYFLQYSGGSRAIELGLITEEGLFKLASTFIILAGVCGFSLILGPWVTSWELFYYALAGALGGYFYTAPPLKLSSRKGLGELSIGLLFGPVLTMGTVYAMTGIHSWEAFLIGIPLGLLTTAILWINQFPDTPSDIATGKVHLVAALGLTNARWGYLLLMVGAFSSLLILYLTEVVTVGSMLAMLALPVSAWLTYRLFEDYQSRDLVKTNINTIYLQMATGLLMIIGVQFALFS